MLGPPRLAVLVAVALALPVATASGRTPAEGSRFEPAVEGAGGAVSSVSPKASAAAAAVLDRGGNAVDAAVTAVFALGVERPELCGLGGGGTMVVRTAAGEAAALDFREQSSVGYGTGRPAGSLVGVPGTVAGMAAALDRYGTISLARAIAPAEALARKGITVTPQQAALFAQDADRLGAVDETRSVLLKDGGAPYEAGDRLELGDYADTLALIARNGPRAFYEGRVAAAIVKAVGAGDGAVGSDDLAGYRPFWRRPLEADHRGAQVLTVPPPAAGGQVLVETLDLLDGMTPYPAQALGAARLHRVAEAEKLAWADQAAFTGDPRYTSIPLARLLGPEYLDERRPELLTGRAGTYAPARPAAAPSASGATSPGATARSTSVTVIDAQGDAVAVSCSLQDAFGSAIVAEGTGFPLNDALTAFDPAGPNAAGPAKRPRSYMTPAVVARDGRPVLAVAAGGGSSTVAGVLDVVVDVLDFGEDVAHAVDAPRADPRGQCAGDGLQLCVEDARLAPAVLDELAGRGHRLVRLGEYALMPEVQAVAVTARGRRQATSDPRGETGPAAQKTALAALAVGVSPKHPRPGRHVTLRFRVRAGGKAVARARVRVAGARATTGSSGRVTVLGRMRKGTVTAVVTRKGYASAAVRVPVG